MAFTDYFTADAVGALSDDGNRYETDPLAASRQREGAPSPGDRLQPTTPIGA